jgi:hypothetical protein
VRACAHVSAYMRGGFDLQKKCFAKALGHLVNAGIGVSTQGVMTALAAVEKGLAAMHHEGDDYKKAALARVLRLETMIEARKLVDAAEAECPAHIWPLATYKEMLFLDANQDAHGNTI